MLNACGTKEASAPALEILSSRQNSLVMDISDTFIPVTTTPGATDAGVNTFIDLVLRDVMTEEESRTFLSGLEAFDQTCLESMGKTFHDCTPEEREQVLKASSDTPLYKSIRELTYRAYYTSEQGIKQNFNYVPIPGKYEACADMAGQEKRMKGNHL